MAYSESERQEYLHSLLGYMRGELTNLDLDDAFMAVEQDDDLFEVGSAIWSTYDDFRPHPIRDPLVWALYRRMAAYLLLKRTGLPPKPAKVPHPWIPLFKVGLPDPTWFPFESQHEWREAANILSEHRVPSMPPGVTRIQHIGGRRWRNRLRQVRSSPNP